MQIRNCPHCGGIAYLHQTYSRKCKCYFIAVKCDICGAAGKPYTSETAASDDNWQSDACRDAVRAWNLRVTDRAESQKGQETDGQ